MHLGKLLLTLLFVHRIEEYTYDYTRPIEVVKTTLEVAQKQTLKST